MAELKAEHTFPYPLAPVFAAVRAYEKFPDYLPGVTGIKVLPPSKAGSVARVRYEIKIIKSFHYSLHMFETAPGKLWWELEESNIFKKLLGSWALTSVGPQRTLGVYTLEVGFSGFIPQMMVDQVTKANLPLMFSGYEKLASHLAAQGLG